MARPFLSVLFVVVERGTLPNPQILITEKMLISNTSDELEWAANSNQYTVRCKILTGKILMNLINSLQFVKILPFKIFFSNSCLHVPF